MSEGVQLAIVIFLVVVAIFYFIQRSRRQNKPKCDDICSKCDIYNHCKRKK